MMIELFEIILAVMV